MRVGEKTHHIDITINSGSKLLLPIIKEHYPNAIILEKNENEDELIAMEQSPVYQEGKLLLQIPGNRLFVFRNKKGVTQQQLAQQAGVRRETISLLEHGKRHLGVNLAKKLAPPLGVGYKDLLPDEEN